MGAFDGRFGAGQLCMAAPIDVSMAGRWCCMARVHTI